MRYLRSSPPTSGLLFSRVLRMTRITGIISLNAAPLINSGARSAFVHDYDLGTNIEMPVSDSLRVLSED